MQTEAPHTPETSRIIQPSLDLSHWLIANNPRGFTFDALPDDLKGQKTALDFRMRHKLAFAHFELALDHHTAIVHLCLNHLRSSAFPLARSLFDATWKGAWVAFAAPQDLLDKYVRGTYKLKPNSALKALSNLKIGESQQSVSPFLSAVFTDAYDHLSEYIHAGLLPVSRWLGEDEISANYTDEEMKEILRLSDKLAACCGIFLAEICNTGRKEVRSMLADVMSIGPFAPA
jgi:hypothetical protein